MSWEGRPAPIEELALSTVAVLSGGRLRKRARLASVVFFTTTSSLSRCKPCMHPPGNEVCRTDELTRPRTATPFWDAVGGCVSLASCPFNDRRRVKRS